MRRMISIVVALFMLATMYAPTVSAAESYEVKQKKMNMAICDAMEYVDKDKMTEVEIALALHNYLASTVTYAIDEYLAGDIKPERYTAYGALVDKIAVCNGYAEAYQELMQRAGIPCSIVSSEREDHAWNVVRINGEWYHVDVTFDDIEQSDLGRVEHRYFLISTETLLEYSSSRSDYVVRDVDPEYEYVEATDKSFENGFWTDVDTALYHYNGDWYYVDRHPYRIMKYDYLTGNTETLLEEDIKWPMWHGNYEKFFMFDGCIYYIMPTEIRKIDLDEESAPTVVHAIDADAGYIQGVGATNGKLMYVTIKEPYEYGAEVFHSLDVFIEHDWTETGRKAPSCLLDGHIAYQCNRCGEDGMSTLLATRNVSDCKIVLSQSVYTYTGKAHKPSVTLYDSNGLLVDPKFYSVGYLNYVDASDIYPLVSVHGNADKGYGGVVSANYIIEKAKYDLHLKKSRYTKKAGCKAFNLHSKRVSDVKYKSSNKKVATVNKNGRVIVKKAGKAVITISRPADRNYEKAVEKVILRVKPKKK